MPAHWANGFTCFFGDSDSKGDQWKVLNPLLTANLFKFCDSFTEEMNFFVFFYQCTFKRSLHPAIHLVFRSFVAQLLKLTLLTFQLRARWGRTPNRLGAFHLLSLKLTPVRRRISRLANGHWILDASRGNCLSCFNTLIQQWPRSLQRCFVH